MFCFRSVVIRFLKFQKRSSKETYSFFVASLMDTSQFVDGCELRLVSSSEGWDDRTDDAPLKRMLTGTISRLKQSDPCRGEWCVDSKELDVWVDRRPLASGVMLESRVSVIEDACWLRSESELHAIRKGSKPSYTLGN